jgi:hypothetical protein
MRDTAAYIVGMLALLSLAAFISYDFYLAATGQETFSLYVRTHVAKASAPHVLVGIGVAVGFVLGLVVGFVLGHLFWS